MEDNARYGHIIRELDQIQSMLRDNNDKLDKLSNTISFMRGKTAGASAVFGILGGVLVEVISHYVTK